MTDEIRVDTSGLHGYLNILYDEKALAGELSERLDRVKQMVSDELCDDVVYAEQKAQCIYSSLSEVAESMVYVADIFDTLQRNLSQMLQDSIDEMRV